VERGKGFEEGGRGKIFGSSTISNTFRSHDAHLALANGKEGERGNSRGGKGRGDSSAE